jgi:pyrroloquinoline quinone (PQQ) biosynthesis protein C
MAPNLEVASKAASSAPIAERMNEIRNRWHTKRHPFFREFSEGRLPLKALARYQALHYHYVSYALPSFGLLYARAYKFEDIRKMMAENLAEEEGFKAIPRQGHEPHDHNELMFRFCRAAGLSDAEVRNMKMTLAWWACSLYYYNAAVVEPIGVVLAMLTTQKRPDARAHRRGAAARLRETLRVQANRA